MPRADLKAEPDAPMSTQSPLLSLPAELQLIIYEMVVVEKEPLPINCGCDSTFGGHNEEYAFAQQQWANGHLHSPWQPALTRTCRAIRADTIPMYYSLNVFRAYYCHPSDFVLVVDWLKLVGATNRRMLRDFCLHDDNPSYDDQIPNKIRQRTLHLWREFCGVSIERIDVGRGLEHRVDFTHEIDPLDDLDLLFGENERSSNGESVWTDRRHERVTDV